MTLFNYTKQRERDLQVTLILPMCPNSDSKIYTEFFKTSIGQQCHLKCFFAVKCIKCINKQVDFEKMSWQWLLAYNLLSNFVCTFKNVAEGYIHAKNANMGGAIQSI